MSILFHSKPALLLVLFVWLICFCKNIRYSLFRTRKSIMAAISIDQQLKEKNICYYFWPSWEKTTAHWRISNYLVYNITNICQPPLCKKYDNVVCWWIDATGTNKRLKLLANTTQFNDHSIRFVCLIDKPWHLVLCPRIAIAENFHQSSP